MATNLARQSLSLETALRSNSHLTEQVAKQTAKEATEQVAKQGARGGDAAQAVSKGTKVVEEGLQWSQNDAYIATLYIY